MKIIATVIGLFLMSFFAGFAFASDNTGKFYVQGDLGTATYTNATAVINGVTNTFPNPGNVVIAAGYRINPVLAAELGYSSFGTSTLTVIGGGGSAAIDAKSIYLAGVGTYEVTPQFNLFGKLGMSSNSVSENLTGGLVFTGTGATSASASQSSVLYGFGAGYAVTENTSVTAQYLNFGNFTSNSPQASATSFSFGVAYTFK